MRLDFNTGLDKYIMTNIEEGRILLINSSKEKDGNIFLHVRMIGEELPWNEALMKDLILNHGLLDKYPVVEGYVFDPEDGFTTEELAFLNTLYVEDVKYYVIRKEIDDNGECASLSYVLDDEGEVLFDYLSAVKLAKERCRYKWPTCVAVAERGTNGVMKPGIKVFNSEHYIDFQEKEYYSSVYGKLMSLEHMQEMAKAYNIYNRYEYLKENYGYLPESILQRFAAEVEAYVSDNLGDELEQEAIKYVLSKISEGSALL